MGNAKMAPLLDEGEPPARPEDGDFKALLRNGRLAAGLTTKGLADVVGFSHQYINDMERGNRAPPSEEVVRRFAAPLALSDDELAYWIMCAEWSKVPECWRREIVRLRNGNKEQGADG